MRGFFIYGHAFEGEVEGEAVFDLDLPLSKEERQQALKRKEKKKSNCRLPFLSSFFSTEQPPF
jgi:hypothetical protein